MSAEYDSAKPQVETLRHAVLLLWKDLGTTNIMVLFNIPAGTVPRSPSAMVSRLQMLEHCTPSNNTYWFHV